MNFRSIHLLVSQLFYFSLFCLALNQPRQVHFLLHHAVVHLLLELAQLLSDVGLALAQGLLHLLEVHLVLQVALQLLLHSHQVFDAAPVGEFLAQTVECLRRALMSGVEVDPLLVHELLDEVGCFLDVALAFFGQLAELLLEGVDLVESLFSVGLDLVNVVFHFVVAVLPIHLRVSLDNLQLLQDLSLRLTQARSQEFRIDFFRNLFVKSIKHAEVSLFVQVCDHAVLELVNFVLQSFNELINVLIRVFNLGFSLDFEVVKANLKHLKVMSANLVSDILLETLQLSVVRFSIKQSHQLVDLLMLHSVLNS